MTVFIHKNILNSSLSWRESSETNPWYRVLWFSTSHGFTQHFLFLVFEILLCFLLCFTCLKLYYVSYCVLHVWNSIMFPIMFYVTCSDNAKSADCLFKCHLVTSHTPHFTLLISTLIRMIWSSTFKFEFRRSFFRKKIK